MDSDLEAFCTINITTIQKLLDLWHKELPMVDPHYAVKCCSNLTLVKNLFKLGNTGFDCASPAEVILAKSVGCKPERIIYANPQKTPESIKKAYELGVNCFTFDSEMELVKMIENTPLGVKGRFVLRLLPPDESHSVCQFGVKFGANCYEARRLLALNQVLKKQYQNVDFDIIGFSFHVGSGSMSTDQFRQCVEFAGEMARIGKEELGYKEFTMLDIGGGYMTQDAMKHFMNHTGEGQMITFEDTAKVLREAIQKVSQYFSPDWKIIAEPGRFFANDPMTLAIRIFGRKIEFDESSVEPSESYVSVVTEEELSRKRHIKRINYHVGEGLHGYFNCLLFDHAAPHVLFFKNGRKVNSHTYLSTIYGQTSSPDDILVKDVQMPIMNQDDWLVVENFGAYTWGVQSGFAGVELVKVVEVEEK